MWWIFRFVPSAASVYTRANKLKCVVMVVWWSLMAVAGLLIIYSTTKPNSTHTHTYGAVYTRLTIWVKCSRKLYEVYYRFSRARKWLLRCGGRYARVLNIASQQQNSSLNWWLFGANALHAGRVARSAADPFAAWKANKLQLRHTDCSNTIYIPISLRHKPTIIQTALLYIYIDIKWLPGKLYVPILCVCVCVVLRFRV